MIISNSRRYIFVHIHKAGGTSVELALNKSLSWNDIALGSTPFAESINEPYAKRFGLNKHSSVAEIEKICGPEILQDYFVFTLVRHPLGRLCSLYNFVGSIIERAGAKVGLTKSDMAAFETKPELIQKCPELAWPASQAFVSAPDFSQFIRDQRLQRDPGFHSQVSRMRNASAKRPVGQALQLEDIPRLTSTIRSRLGVDFEMPHANKSEQVLIKSQDVSDDDLKFIRQFYREDFLYLGY